MSSTSTSTHPDQRMVVRPALINKGVIVLFSLLPPPERECECGMGAERGARSSLVGFEGGVKEE